MPVTTYLQLGGERAPYQQQPPQPARCRESREGITLLSIPSRAAHGVAQSKPDQTTSWSYTMKTSLEAIKRAWVLFQIRALEATLDGQNKALRLVECQCTRWKIETARGNTKRALAQLRSEYSLLLPPGQTVTWRLA